MSSRSRKLAVIAATPVVALTLLWVVHVEHLLLVANAVATLSLLALLATYHRYTAWWTTAVGRSTVALKGSILVLAVGGLVRRIGEQLELAGSVRAPVLLDQVAATIVYLGWVLMAASTTWRLVVMARYLRRRPGVGAPPPN